MKEFNENRQEYLALMIGSEGREGHSSKKDVIFACSSFVR
jgi:hypothetical protein